MIPRWKLWDKRERNGEIHPWGVRGWGTPIWLGMPVRKFEVNPDRRQIWVSNMAWLVIKHFKLNRPWYKLLCYTCSHLDASNIRSNSGILLEPPRGKRLATLGERAFQAAAPHLWNELPLQLCTIKSVETFKNSIGPLHDLVTWYKIKYTGEQVAQWDFQNKGRSRWTGTSCFVLEVPLCNLLTSIFNFVPCDRIVQRAY